MKNIFQHLTSVLVLTLFVFIAFGSMEDDKTPGSSEGQTVLSGEKTVQKGIGDTLSTRYFDITINEVRLQDQVNTGNQFADLKKEDGNQYLILNTTFKNTDSESRMISDGEVLINYSCKEYRFDNSETIMMDGWGIFLDQINPLTSKTTNIVYKLPVEISGTAYYRPGRSSDDDLILIGNIE